MFVCLVCACKLPFEDVERLAEQSPVRLCRDAAAVEDRTEFGCSRPVGGARERCGRLPVAVADH